MSQPWGTCRKRRNVTHHTQEEGQAGPENSLYLNILSSFLCFVVEEQSLHTGSWARNKTPRWRSKQRVTKTLISSTKDFLYSKLVLSQSRSLKIEPETLFWISILSLYNHPQLSSRKGNETQDDRKAFPEVKPCCHHGLFTVSVSMATP